MRFDYFKAEWEKSFPSLPLHVIGQSGRENMTDSDSAIYGPGRPDGRDRRRRENRRHVRKEKKLLPEMFHLFTDIIAISISFSRFRATA